MEYTITIQKEDVAYIKEAIKLRAMAIIQSIDDDVASQSETFGPCSALSADSVIKAEGAPFSFATAPVKAEGAPVSFTVNATNKKPHWTQTAKGKKIMAARKRKGTK